MIESPRLGFYNTVVNSRDRTNTADPKRILVYMPTWVGDVVMTTPALRALRKRFADSHITLICRGNAAPVLAGSPLIDEIIPLTRSKKRGLFAPITDTLANARAIRGGTFDAAVLLSNSFRAAATVRWAGVRRRVGYDRDRRGWLLTDRVAVPRDGDQPKMISAVRYYNDLAIMLGCDDPGDRLELAVDERDDRVVGDLLAGWGVADHHPLVVINPGASFGPSKLWPPERFAAVADRLVVERDAAVVITCGPGEQDLARRVRASMEQPSRVCDDPMLTLGQLKAIIRRCDLLLNNDTGPRHFAKAFDRSVVTVFGSTHPGWTDTDYANERKIRIDVDCGPCHIKVCPLGHHKCMTGVTVDMVYGATVELLDGAPARLEVLRS